MTPLAFLVYALATWRLASLLCCEDGPGEIFKRLRAAAGPSAFLSELLDCVWCCSVWVGLALALAGLDAPLMTRVVAGFAFSGVAILIQRWMEVQERRLA